MEQKVIVENVYDFSVNAEQFKERIKRNITVNDPRTEARLMDVIRRNAEKKKDAHGSV